MSKQRLTDKKCSPTRGAYSDCSPYAPGNGPARATRHFAVPEKTVKQLVLNSHLWCHCGVIGLGLKLRQL